jgi:hypothetical protein|nr:MAG TPA: hypothetical protein [Caudoviricetes sp.]
MEHWELFVGETMWFPDSLEGVVMISAEQRLYVKQPLRTILTESKTYLKEYCEYVSLERASKDDGRFPVTTASLVLRQGNHVKLCYKAGVWELEVIRDFNPVARTLFYDYDTAADKFIVWSLAAVERD